LLDFAIFASFAVNRFENDKALKGLRRGTDESRTTTRPPAR
jgi:hypothetical protein